MTFSKDTPVMARASLHHMVGTFLVRSRFEFPDRTEPWPRQARSVERLSKPHLAPDRMTWPLLHTRKANMVYDAHHDSLFDYLCHQSIESRLLVPPIRRDCHHNKAVSSHTDDYLYWSAPDECGTGRHRAGFRGQENDSAVPAETINYETEHEADTIAMLQGPYGNSLELRQDASWRSRMQRGSSREAQM